MSKHVAIYLRDSIPTRDTASQEQDLKLWADEEDEPVRWYRDTPSSFRASWDQLGMAIRAGEVSMLVVWRLERLGQNTQELVSLFDDLVEREIKLEVLKQKIDLDTAQGRLIMNVLAGLVQFEEEIEAERE